MVLDTIRNLEIQRVLPNLKIVSFMVAPPKKKSKTPLIIGLVFSIGVQRESPVRTSATSSFLLYQVLPMLDLSQLC